MSDNGSPANHPQAPIDDSPADSAGDHPAGQPGLFSLLPDEDRRAIWDRLASYPPNDPKPAPVSRAQQRFDADFWQVAGPRLLALIAFYAALVQLEVYSFQEAWEQVWQAGMIRGAARLSEGSRLTLHDWIDHELMLRVDDPLPEGLVTPERLRFLTGEN